MAERLPERLPGWARVVVLIAVWVALYISLVHRLWPVVCVVGIGAVIWLFWLERGTTPRRTIAGAVGIAVGRSVVAPRHRVVATATCATARLFDRRLLAGQLAFQ